MRQEKNVFEECREQEISKLAEEIFKYSPAELKAFIEGYSLANSSRCAYLEPALEKAGRSDLIKKIDDLVGLSKETKQVLSELMNRLDSNWPISDEVEKLFKEGIKIDDSGSNEETKG
ncbi:MAG: hypothetical protein HY831_03335 [Candidatus Aenigmarchaeota archaeon]|nr:hypothetical protein [Candidatus Aenigmarchaeota archaeon]